MRAVLVLVVWGCFALQKCGAFYVPGVAPVEFRQGQKIDVKAIKLTSVKTQLPYEYYALPFCRPEGPLQFKSENLGEVLRGDRIVNTPYKVSMKNDLLCAAVCGSTEKPTVITPTDSEQLMKRISEEYHVHLLVDNLPCATKISLPDTSEVYYDHGYRLGYVSGEGKVYVNNHLQIVLQYHEPNPGEFRVVGFEVEPKSVDWHSWTFHDDVCSMKDANIDTPQEILKGENKLLWTYSVRWERSDVRWASRWDTYLAMRDVQIHWFSIVNSIVVVFCLSGFLWIILVRTVRRDISHYNQLDDMEDTLEESGWKLVHGDVFRPPANAKFLSSLVGTGVQLFGVALFTIFLAMLGMLSPASRGSIMSAALFLYCFMGLVGGYYAGRLYKTWRGVQWKRAAFQTGSIFPAVIFATGLMMNFFLMGKHSSGAVPFTTMLALLFMWSCIDLPLVFFGFYFGYRKQTYSHPVRTNQIPRQVPEAPWYLQPVPSFVLAGVLPFGAMFIELFFIFSAIWENQFYYLFGFLFLVFVILTVSCAQISIVVTYFQLCAENYRWWWRSFVVGGSSSFYVLAYSVFYYFTKLEIVGFTPTLLYASYSVLMSFGFFLFTGAVGLFASYLFVCRIYSAVKID